jgi:hypothetical protein
MAAIPRWSPCTGQAVGQVGYPVANAAGGSRPIKERVVVAGYDGLHALLLVIPAKAGIQNGLVEKRWVRRRVASSWIPAFAGMTKKGGPRATWKLPSLWQGWVRGEYRRRQPANPGLGVVTASLVSCPVAGQLRRDR